MPRHSTVVQELQQTRPFGSPAEEAAVGLLLTADLMKRRMSAVVEPAGITHQQYNVLRILRGSHPEPMPTLAIAERMIEQTPGITRLLDRLESKGLVARERGSDDRRCVYCRITDRGLALLATLDEALLDVASQAFASLGRGQQLAWITQLDAIRASLRDRAKPSAAAG
jgi:DNA-binding MarR family transcriptional regulator